MCAERKALLEVELDAFVVGADESDCEVLAERELEVTAAATSGWPQADRLRAGGGPVAVLVIAMNVLVVEIYAGARGAAPR